MAATPDGGGYRRDGADGAVFNHGDATAEGSALGYRPAAPAGGIE